MNSDVITITSRGSHMDAALQQAEKVAAYKDLSPRAAADLRLLTEETLGMMRSIAGEVEGAFWIEEENGDFQLHLRVKTVIDAKQRSQLLSVSSSGKNEFYRGVWGKILEFFEPLNNVPLMETMALGDYEAGSSLYWSMSAYRSRLLADLEQRREGAEEDWDELEKTLIAHLADDVKVGIDGSDVEMVILKRLVD